MKVRYVQCYCERCHQVHLSLPEDLPSSRKKTIAFKSEVFCKPERLKKFAATVFDEIPVNSGNKTDLILTMDVGETWSCTSDDEVCLRYCDA